MNEIKIFFPAADACRLALSVRVASRREAIPKALRCAILPYPNDKYLRPPTYYPITNTP
ncbi:hypothetical protein [Nostoc sp.]|uniref:hypothetical protein n=1 Tax=Nostoc sp. TaxID=1180 RepID=UPI002FFBEDD9